MDSQLYLIYGADEFLVTGKAKEIVARLVPPEDAALGLEIIDGNADKVADAITALGKCDEALRTVGFFGAQKVVWFRDVSFLTDNRTGKSQDVKDRVNDLADLIKSGLPDGVVFVVSSPKVNGKYAFFKACKKYGELHEFDISDKAWQKEKSARERLNDLLKKSGLKMSGDVQTFFMEKAGFDTRQMANELEKLQVYLGSRDAATKADIEAITCSSKDALAWDLADAFGRRDLKNCLKVLKQLLFQKESPIRLIMAIESRVRELLIYREAVDRGWLTLQSGYKGKTLSWSGVPADIDEIYSESLERDPRKTHPFRGALLVEQARLFSLNDLMRLHRMTINAHETLVTSRIPQEVTLELLLIQMLGR